MCGVVGLLLKDGTRRPELGRLVTGMFETMGERGPDSGGLAVFGEPTTGALRRFNVFAPRRDYPWSDLATALDAPVEALENHAVVSLAGTGPDFRRWLAEYDPELHLLSAGRRINVWKDVGAAGAIAKRYRFPTLAGTHAVGHTRMATESAVSPARAHPFTAGEDFCLVHNGSLSNPNMLRRKLEAEGVAFETDNDTEAACRLIEWRLRVGDTLEQALEVAFRELDGFYTLVMGTGDSLTLVRDAFACKPAVIAETDSWVAIASEFRALAHLPDVASANVFEPEPERIYTWTVPH